MKPTLAFLAGLIALSATPVSAQQWNAGWDRERYCLGLFFTDYAKHAVECPSRGRPEPGSIHTLYGEATPVVPVVDPVEPHKPHMKPKKWFKKKWFWKRKFRFGR